MANDMVVVEKVTRGHLMSSSKVISKYKGDLTNNFDQVGVWYHWKALALARESLTMDIEMMTVARGIIHQRLLKVTNQGHLKRYIDLTVKCDQVYV